MAALTMRKKIRIVEHYLGGLSYDEIVAKVGMSKGSIAHVVADLKAGRFPEGEGLGEQVDLLRDLGIQLRKTRVTAGEAGVGAMVLSRLVRLGIEPKDIGRWADLCREMAGDEGKAQGMVAAALTLREICQRTGLGFEELRKEVTMLEEQAKRLKPRIEGLLIRQAEVKEAESRLAEVQKEVSRLEARQDELGKDVAERERREEALSQRVLGLEDRAASADERLAVARKDIQTLAGMGMSAEDTSELVARLKRIAERHSIGASQLSSRLFSELESLDTGLGLESLVARRQEELRKQTTALVTVERRRKALEGAVKELEERRESLHGAIEAEEKQVRRKIRSIGNLLDGSAEALVKKWKTDMDQACHEMAGLTTQATELGRQMGRIEGLLESNKWLGVLLSLVQGTEGIDAAEVRALALIVMRPFVTWFRTQEGPMHPELPLVKMKAEELVSEVERWSA